MTSYFTQSSNNEHEHNISQQAQQKRNTHTTNEHTDIRQLGRVKVVCFRVVKRGNQLVPNTTTQRQHVMKTRACTIVLSSAAAAHYGRANG